MAKLVTVLDFVAPFAIINLTEKKKASRICLSGFPNVISPNQALVNRLRKL